MRSLSWSLVPRPRYRTRRPPKVFCVIGKKLRAACRFKLFFSIAVSMRDKVCRYMRNASACWFLLTSAKVSYDSNPGLEFCSETSFLRYFCSASTVVFFGSPTNRFMCNHILRIVVSWFELTLNKCQLVCFS